MKKSWLLRAAHAATDNELYRRCIQRRQQLVLRHYDGRYFGYQHAVQQRFWEFWLDRFEQAQWWCGTLDRRLWLTRRDVETVWNLARHLNETRRMRD